MAAEQQQTKSFVQGGPSEVSAARVLTVGDTIGRYRIRDRIGEGAMGVVYAAEDPELGRLVAIKLLRPAEGKDAEIQQRRLLREAQALAKVSHRNLVTVYDVGTHRGRVFVAMEYLSGETLEQWVEREQPRWPAVLDVFIEAGRGLAAVHAAGLVHRDFKPGNVIVGEGGQVQVLDFGLARRADEGLSPDELTAKPSLDALASTLTETGGIMGTPAYMAPEQFMRLQSDARADQFSFCVALYEALYGPRPFDGADLGELMLATVDGLRHRPPPLPGMPETVRTALERGLSSEPDQRFSDMNELVAVLEKAREPSAPRTLPIVKLAKTVLLLGGLAGAAVAGAWWAGGATDAVAGDEGEPVEPSPTVAEVPSEQPPPEQPPADATPVVQVPADAAVDALLDDTEGGEVPLDEPASGSEDAPLDEPAAEPADAPSEEPERRSRSRSRPRAQPVPPPIDEEPSNLPGLGDLHEKKKADTSRSGDKGEKPSPPKDEPKPGDEPSEPKAKDEPSEPKPKADAPVDPVTEDGAP